MLVAALVLAAGGWSFGTASVAQADEPAPVPAPGVVALVDSGINPYHEAFRAASGDDAVAWAARLGLDATPVTLAATGNYSSRVEADRAFWDSVVPGRLYAFAGTRVLGVTMGLAVVPNGVRILDEGGHGTRVASVAAREAPGALLVAVQVSARVCDAAPQRCLTDPSVAMGMSWAANQSWVDVVSVSLGYPANAPSGATSEIHPETAAYVEASRRAHESGKLVVVSASNDPSPVMADFFDGPPWLISVGGANPRQNGQTLLSSSLPDVVANFTTAVARHDSVAAHEWGAGTSFAAPVVAATLAEVRAAARAALGDAAASAWTTPTLVRDVLNASARPTPTEAWNPLAPPERDPIGPPGSVPPIVHQTSAPSLAPGQMGWGYVDGSIVDEMVRRVLTGDASLPAHKQDDALLRAAHQRAREALWGAPT